MLCGVVGSSCVYCQLCIKSRFTRKDQGIEGRSNERRQSMQEAGLRLPCWLSSQSNAHFSNNGRHFTPRGELIVLRLSQTSPFLKTFLPLFLAFHASGRTFENPCRLCLRSLENPFCQLLAAIFRFLDHRTLLRIRRVCKFFADVVHGNGRGWWASIGGSGEPGGIRDSVMDFETCMPDDSLKRLLEKIKGVVKLSATGYLAGTKVSAATMKVLFERHRTTLVSIDLASTSARLDLSIFSNWVLMANSSTEEEPIEDPVLPKLHDFATLCAPDPRAPPSKHAADLLPILMDIIYRSPELESLSLINMPRHFPFPDRPLPLLKKLRVSSPVFRPRTFPLFPGNIPHPPSFHQKHNRLSIVGSFPKLKEIDLTGCDNCFDTDLSYLITAAPELEVLVQRKGEDGSGLLRELLFYPEIGLNLRVIDISSSMRDLSGEEYDVVRKQNLVRMVWESRQGGGRLERICWGIGRVFDGR